MKEYRILQLEPELAIINIRDDDGLICGYTDHGTAVRDLHTLKGISYVKDTRRVFVIVGYIELEM